MKKITSKITHGITIKQQSNNNQITTNKNDKNNNNEKNNNNSSSNIRNENISKINDLMLECLNTTNINNIKECIEYLDKLPFELIEYALKKTSRIDRPSWKYTMSILDSYIQNRFISLKEVEADELSFKNKNKIDNKEETEEEKRKRKIRELEELFNANK